MRKIISPSQVKRFDGNKVFVEVMADGISMNKVLLNFCQYDKSGSKGNRMKATIPIYIDIGTAGLLANDILSGKIVTEAKKSRAEAEKKGSKYPNPVWTQMGGTNPLDAKREDNKAESRQLKLVPGSVKPWILTAEKGAGHLSETGLIVPDYTSGKGDSIIRVPMTDESLKELGLLLKNLQSLWTVQKFGEINNFDPSSLKGYTATGMKKTSIMEVFKQAEKGTEDPDLRLNVDVSALSIGKVLFNFQKEGNILLSIYMDITKAQVFAQDILSGRLERIKQKRISTNSTDPLFHLLGGSIAKDGKVLSRQFKLLWYDKGWIIQGTAGAGHKSETGLLVPDYTDETADLKCCLHLKTQDLKCFAICIQNCGTLWMFKKFGPIVHEGFVKERKKTEERIASIRNQQ